MLNPISVHYGLTALSDALVDLLQRIWQEMYMQEFSLTHVFVPVS